MEPEGILLCSQEPAIDPYPELDESSIHILMSYFFKIHFNIIFLFTGFTKCSLRFRFPTKILYAFLFSYMLRAPPYP
jgi:hypothetical protein